MNSNLDPQPPKQGPSGAPGEQEQDRRSAGEAGGAEAGSHPDPKDRRSGSDRRASVVDRRSGLDRRDCPPGLKLPAMERRRGPGIRRPEDRRSAEEGEMTTEQFEFVMAIEEYKRANNKTFPTWTEVLEVIKILGYHRDSTTPPAAPAEETSE